MTEHAFVHSFAIQIPAWVVFGVAAAVVFVGWKLVKLLVTAIPD